MSATNYLTPPPRAYTRVRNHVLKNYADIVEKGNVVVEVLQNQTTFRRVWETRMGQKNGKWLCAIQKLPLMRGQYIITKTQFEQLTKQAWEGRIVICHRPAKYRHLDTYFPENTPFIVTSFKLNGKLDCVHYQTKISIEDLSPDEIAIIE